MIELSEETKDAYRYAAKVLKVSDRWLFMFRIVKSLGHGGRSYVHKHLRWDTKTVNKGLQEYRGERQFLGLTNKLTANG